MGFFISENGLKVKGLRTPNCSWIKNANDRFYSIDTGWGRYMNSSTEEIISAVKRINQYSPDFGIDDILISLIVRFNTDIRLSKIFKKVNNNDVPSLFNDSDYVKHYTQRPYVENRLLKYNCWTVGMGRLPKIQSFDWRVYGSEGLYITPSPNPKPKLKVRFTRSDKPGYVNFTVKEQPELNEWEKVYE